MAGDGGWYNRKNRFDLLLNLKIKSTNMVYLLVSCWEGNKERLGVDRPDRLQT